MRIEVFVGRVIPKRPFILQFRFSCRNKPWSRKIEQVFLNSKFYLLHLKKINFFNRCKLLFICTLDLFSRFLPNCFNLGGFQPLLNATELCFYSNKKNNQRRLHSYSFIERYYGINENKVLMKLIKV